MLLSRGLHDATPVPAIFLMAGTLEHTSELIRVTLRGDPLSVVIDLAERGFIPDFLVRIGIRRFVRGRIEDEYRGGEPARLARVNTLLLELGRSEVALETQAANEQHYEVPTGFFELVLGTHMKYSACLFERENTSLDDAEAAMLALYAERAELVDGQQVLDLGCGWGSFTLWAAEKFPRSRFTAVSNSATQRQFIETTALQRGLRNVEVLTRDVNQLEFDSARFDRVVSIEMFEHMRNYSLLLSRIARWLKSDGSLFVHIFCHRETAYPYETEGDGNWMGRYFFTGGLMPAIDTLRHFKDHLEIEQQWSIPGHHYQRTARGWLDRLDMNHERARAVLSATYGPDVDRWLQRWRFFFMACEELFGFRGGNEWLIAHYRMKRRITSE